jgi:sec-independent protein translocase protein TatC
MTSPADGSDREQPLIEHLVELRQRLLRAVVGILIVFLALIPFANELYTHFAAPLLKALPAGSSMIATEVASPFLTPIKLAFFVALMLTMPLTLYQAWGFVAPGLYRHEKRLATPLLVSSALLFYLGCAFAYFLVLPVVFKFLTGVAPEGVAVMTDITHYLDFVMITFLAFGVCFEVPVAVVILVAMGWVTIEQLKAARGYVIIGAFFIAAIVTPPDVLSQIMLAIPMYILYEIGIIAARIAVKKPAETSEVTSS